MIRIFRYSPEAVFNTFDGVTIPPILTPMDTPNSFKNMSTRPPWEIMDGSGLNVPRLRGSEVYTVGGKYQSRAYWETCQYMLGALSRVNSGGTAPWGTDQKLNDLASGSIDFAYTYDDLTYRYGRNTGCKVASATISASNQHDAPFLMLDYDFVGSTPLPNAYGGTAPTVTDIPTPALTAYPANPITFQECAFKFNGTTNNLFDRFSIKIENKVKAYYDNSHFPNRIHCKGRKVTLTVHLLLQSATDPRDTYYEAVAAISAGLSVTFTNPALGGGHTIHEAIKFDFKSNSFVDAVNEDMILDEDAYDEVTAVAYLDTGASTDFAITYTAES
jgi:hypothetical protein